MPSQSYRIVNLDKKQVLDPKLMGNSRQFSGFAFVDSPTMGGLLWLLDNDWSGDRVAIIGNRAQDTDFRISEVVCGIPASQLCFPTLHGHERFKNVSKKTREALAADYGYRFQIANEVTTTVTDEGTEERTSSSVWFMFRSAESVCAGSDDEAEMASQPPFVVIDRNRGDFIKSTSFSSRPGLDRAIANFWEDDDSHSWLPAALAVLLTASMDANDAFFVEGHTSAWAGDNISVELMEHADLEGLRDISTDLNEALVNTDAINRYLTPDSEEDEDFSEED